MNSSEERAVQPPEIASTTSHDECFEMHAPTTLRDKLWYRRGYVRRSLGTLDVLQGPSFALLGDDLKAEDTIFCQIHVALYTTQLVYHA